MAGAKRTHFDNVAAHRQKMQAKAQAKQAIQDKFKNVFAKLASHAGLIDELENDKNSIDTDLAKLFVEVAGIHNEMHKAELEADMSFGK